MAPPVEADVNVFSVPLVAAVVARELVRDSFGTSRADHAVVQSPRPGGLAVGSRRPREHVVLIGCRTACRVAVAEQASPEPRAPPVRPPCPTGRFGPLETPRVTCGPFPGRGRVRLPLE